MQANAPEASEAQQPDFLTHLHLTLKAPSNPIRNPSSADSPDLHAAIKQEDSV